MEGGGDDMFTGGLQNSLTTEITPALTNALTGPALTNTVNNAVAAAFTNAGVITALSNAIATAINQPGPTMAIHGANRCQNRCHNRRENRRESSTLTATNGALTPLTAELHSLLARTHNRNAERHTTTFNIHPVRKTVAGSGRALAIPLTPPTLQPPAATDNALNSICRLLMAATPTTIFTFTNADILTLIEFYHETFNIVVADSLEERQLKVYSWLRY
ncbi:hypothetical protein C8R45DRAFT_1070731 [Mycena sanguinolenta]|nr:hypothetical protein C8R45DRAFT_1070731 [Mycena sanguinolenta]